MTDTPNSAELLPCPFCGTQPKLPDGDGTQYEIWCEDCGGAVAAVQIRDLMTLEERAADSFTNYRYGEEFVERAKLEAIDRWNTRAQPAKPQEQHEEQAGKAGEPVAWQFYQGGRWWNGSVSSNEQRINLEASGYPTRDTHARPAAQAVRLPERKTHGPDDSVSTHWNTEGWNSCLEAVAKLNGIEP